MDLPRSFKRLLFPATKCPVETPTSILRVPRRASWMPHKSSGKMGHMGHVRRVLEREAEASQNCVPGERYGQDVQKPHFGEGGRGKGLPKTCFWEGARVGMQAAGWMLHARRSSQQTTAGKNNPTLAPCSIEVVESLEVVRTRSENCREGPSGREFCRPFAQLEGV